MAAGIYPFRCLDCRERFWINIWLFSKGKFAMCPRCFAVDVVPAELPRTRLSLSQKILLTLGARGYRCSACNRKFLSFKRSQAPKSLGQNRKQTQMPLTS
ncbi:MAG: hypothetical protein M3Y72_21425 [Acidobacteriota bacterium]|nr:hypothetical protein [Acidobacteriota bacterium]